MKWVSHCMPLMQIKLMGVKLSCKPFPPKHHFWRLDGLTYKLHEEDLMICDSKGTPMCIGGVYGGLNSGVTESTTTIFLEAAHFNAGAVRRTSMRHNLRTDAAKRFEKGSDPNVTIKALSRAVDLINRYAEGVVSSEVYDLYPWLLSQKPYPCPSKH